MARRGGGSRGSSEGEAGLAEGGEGSESAGRGKPFACLEEDVGTVSGLEGKREARH